MLMNTIYLYATGVAVTALATMAGAAEGHRGNAMPMNRDVILSVAASLAMGGEPSSAELEIPLYPGARLRPPSAADRNSSDVNFRVNSPLFGFTLVVQKYDSDDSLDKVLGFYEKALAKHGQVVTSGAGKASDQDEEEYEQQLKVGSDTDFRLVAAKKQGQGSSFALVRVKIKGAKGDR